MRGFPLNGIMSLGASEVRPETTERNVMNLGRYRLLVQRGADSDGVSYQAVEEASSQPVEVWLLEGARRDARRWQALSKRLRLVALVQHPAVRAVRELALQHEPPYAALEWLDGALGNDLAGALPLSVVQAVSLGKRLAAGLAAAHKLGLAHGQFAPGCLRGTTQEAVKIDFIHISEPPTALDALFHAPEAVEQSFPSFPADLYGLGCLLGWLVAGEPQSSPPQLEQTAGAELARLIGELRANEPTERPSASNAEERLDALLAGLQAVTPDVAQTHEVTPHPTGTQHGVVRAALTARQLGRFRLLDKLGEGGMGAVYRAEDLTDGSPAAIKVLRPDVVDRPDALRRFLKEARLLGEIKHPNVANLLEVNQDAGVHYLVLEFVSGRRLDQELSQRGRLDEASALAVTAEVARALEDAHQRGIIHRDVKPSNIMLVDAEGTQRFAVKLLDFGLARHVVESASLDMTQPGSLLGTPLYMAPEQWSQQPTDARTDVYALGATLFHLLAGRPPFQAGSAPELLALHCQEPAPSVVKINPQVSEAAGQIIARCLAKSPDERYASAGALLDDLERLLRGEPTSIVAHPRLPACDPRRVLQFDWTWDLQASPEQLWPYVSNTERLNRAAGLPGIEFTAKPAAAGGVRLQGRLRRAGVDNVWQEHPFEWIEGRRLGVLREYSQGVFRWLLSEVDLEPRAGGGTRLTHRVRLEPRGWLGRFVAALEVRIRARKALERVYRRIDAFLTERHGSAASADAFEETAQPSRAQRQRLDELLRVLQTERLDPTVVDALGEFLSQAPPPELARIRPLALARNLRLNPDQTVAVCLHAARAGLLILLWDILCPVCRIPAQIKDTLRAVQDHGRCEACNLDFELDFANSVELIFRAHPDIRTTDLATYCIGGPAHRPHVVAQARVAPKERLELPLALGEGAYRLCGPQLGWNLELQVGAGAAVGRWEVNLATPPRAEQVPTLKLCRQVLSLVNDHAQEVLVRVERTVGRTDALTAARASSLALFRELFPTEVLSPGQLVNVAAVTLLATRLDGARQWYQQLGDARAFALLHEHYRLLEQRIRAAGGAVVKLVDDGILAAFGQPAAAVSAALDLHAVLGQNAGTEALQLCVGVHRGPALAANINGNLDYFGATVRAVTHMLELIRGGELLLTHAVTADPQVAILLQQRGLTGALLEVEIPDQPLAVAQRFAMTKNS
jgi:class 3 adenylate cyclase